MTTYAPFDADNPFSGPDLPAIVPFSPDEVEDPFGPDTEARVRLDTGIQEPLAVPARPAPALAELDAAAKRDLRLAEQRLGAAWPKGGLLEAYLRAATPITSAPTEFHLAAAISAVSTLLGNRVMVQTWGQTIYPHLWTVVVAPSGFFRKTTAINLIHRLVLDAGLLSAFYPSDYSREAALAEFAKQSAGLMVFGEFGSFLAAASRDYSAGIKEDLTNLYDAPEEWRRKLRKEEFRIRRPAIGIFGATTLAWLEDRITVGDLMGGFLARVTFITATEKATEREFSHWDRQARNRLVSGLQRLQEIAPLKDRLTSTGEARFWLYPDESPTEMVLTPEAEALARGFFRAWETEVKADQHSRALEGFAVRLQTATLKLAMIHRASIFALDPSCDPLVLDETSVAWAIAYVRLLWRNVTHLIDQDFATDKDAQKLREIRDFIGDKGCSRSDALRHFGGKSRDFEQFIQTLIERNEVEAETTLPRDLGLERQRQKPMTYYWPGPAHPAYKPGTTGPDLEARRAADEQRARRQAEVVRSLTATPPTGEGLARTEAETTDGLAALLDPSEEPTR